MNIKSINECLLQAKLEYKVLKENKNTSGQHASVAMYY